MNNLSKQELDALHCRHGTRQEFYKIELLDFYGIKKCYLELIDGSISVDSNAEIQRAGTFTFRLPTKINKIPRTVVDVGIILTSNSGKNYNIGIGTDGLLYTQETKEKPTKTATQIKIQDDGVLYTENISTSTIEFELIDYDGFTWEVGVESTGEIYSRRTDQQQKIYYYDEKIEIDWLNDKIKAYMGIKLNDTLKWYPLGVFFMVEPKIRKNICTCTCFDETMYIKQDRIQEPKLFLKGMNYGEVLRYFLISCGVVKINIQPTNLILTADVICDYNKNKLEWFNYFAEQINYTKLTTDENGWFISKKYVEPSPNNVNHIYKDDELSVITGDLDVVMDYYNIPNVFTRIVSNPNVGELVSTYTNNDPTSKFSVQRRKGKKITDIATIDNVANQIELDNIVRKLAFNSVQVEQEVSFNTLNMPAHGIKDILDLRHKELKGIFIEQSYTIQLKAGATMQHKIKRLVRLQ